MSWPSQSGPVASARKRHTFSRIAATACRVYVYPTTSHIVAKAHDACRTGATFRATARREGDFATAVSRFPHQVAPHMGAAHCSARRGSCAPTCCDRASTTLICSRTFAIISKSRKPQCRTAKPLQDEIDVLNQGIKDGLGEHCSRREYTQIPHHNELEDETDETQHEREVRELQDRTN